MNAISFAGQTIIDARECNNHSKWTEPHLIKSHKSTNHVPTIGCKWIIICSSFIQLNEFAKRKEDEAMHWWKLIKIKVDNQFAWDDFSRKRIMWSIVIYAYFYHFVTLSFCCYWMNEEVNAYAINIRPFPNRNIGLNFFIRNILFREEKTKKKTKTKIGTTKLTNATCFLMDIGFCCCFIHTVRCQGAQNQHSSFILFFVAFFFFFFSFFFLVFLRIIVIQSILQPIFICDLHFIWSFICNVARKKKDTLTIIYSFVEMGDSESFDTGMNK